ncbi:hypothetical protein BH10PSE10_BH10PSE10_02820 [soil metagenome]
MLKRLQPPADLKIDAASLRRYTAPFKLIPLHGYDCKTKRHGRTTLDGKRPRDKDWTRRKYNSRQTIESADSGNHNVGVRLKPEQLVLDIDPRNGGDEGFLNLCFDLGLDSDTWPHVITGSGGHHYYLSKPADVLVVDTLESYPGVEFKSAGRQVVAAGSIHPETLQHYVWDEDAPEIEYGVPECPRVLLKLIKRPERESDGVGGTYSNEQIANALAALDPCDFNTNDKWFPLIASVHHASGGEARQEFVDWSTGDPAYRKDAYIIGRRWDSFHADRGDGYTSKTLEYHLRKAGRPELQVSSTARAAEDFPDDLPEDDGPASTGEFETGLAEITPVEERGLRVKGNNSTAIDTYENAVIAVRRSGLDIAWDELKQSAVVRSEKLPWDESYGRILNDHVARIIRLHFVNKFQGNAYSPSKDNLYEALFTVAYSSKFNPVIEYLDSLNWDGILRINNLFAEYFNCGDDDYTRAVSRCFMVGAVRRMRRPGCKFDTMPVLKSPQGWNKSTAIRVLFGVDWYSDADLGNLSNKDASMKLRGIWAQEFAEIDSLSHAGVGTLKAFMSRAVDRQRDPYNRIVEDVPRRCVFVGTVNEGGYLKDTTGARRFWPMDLQARIDIEALAADRDQLWAEAAAMEAAGESDVLPQELWPVAAERQAAQTTADPWCDTITALLTKRANAFAAYDPDDDEDGDGPPPSPDKIHTSELFDNLGIPDRDQTKGYSQRLRTVMEALGWTHARSLRIGDDVLAGYIRDK